MAATTAPSKSSKRKGSAANKNLEELKDISDDVIESDFVPYACLFDPGTIATKDGEILQTIKIAGVNYDGASQGNLRAAIRAAIRNHIPDTSYALWLHTLRRKQPAPPRAHFPDAFSGKIDEAWRSLQPPSAAYVNELYLTIIKAGESSALLNPDVLKRSFFAVRNQQRRIEVMEDGLGQLNAVTASMVKTLANFGARQLTMVEREGVFYSEQLEFLEKLINLEERPMPMPERDLSQVLTSGEITFGFNAMEVRTAEGVRRFAAILTLKEYKESTLAGIDKFLEIPCEIIISQCFDYTGNDVARSVYEKQASYLRYSGDKELAQWMEIDRLMGSDDYNAARDFGQQQTTMFLISPSLNQLEANVRMVQRALNRLGMVVVREDLRFEDCYWSQLPANFSFIARKQPVDTEHLAGFVNLQAAPMGNASGSAWGQPVTTFTTLQDAPYYFNFHRQQSAHTIVLGNPGSGRATFSHFLLSQARKLPVSIWYLDVHGTASPFISAMGGECLQPGTSNCKLNPFLMNETPANREFLALWLSTLVDPTGVSLNRSTLQFFQSVVDSMLQLPREQRRMSALVHFVREADAMLANSLMRYVGGNVYGDLFDMPEDNFAPGNLSLWDISKWMSDPFTRVPLTGYLLHRLTGALSGNPTIIALDEGFHILDTPLFSARIAAWCDYIAQHNAAAFLMTDAIEESAARAYTSVISAKASTIFAMADRNPDTGYSMGFGFTPEEVSSLATINGREHHVVQKRGAETVVIKTNINSLPQAVMDTLSGKQKPTVSAADALAELMGYNKQAV